MIDKIYVMSRPDGWHKIGISSDPHYRRKFLGAGVRLVHSVELGKRNAFIVEKYAHTAMGDAQSEGEWFAASADACIAAIETALDQYETCSPEQWKKIVEARWRASGQRGSNNGKIGRKGITLTAEQRREWSRIWKSKDYATNEEALEAMGKPFKKVTATKLFGPSGRSPGPRKSEG